MGLGIVGEPFASPTIPNGPCDTSVRHQIHRLEVRGSLYQAARLTKQRQRDDDQADSSTVLALPASPMPQHIANGAAFCCGRASEKSLRVSCTQRTGMFHMEHLGFAGKTEIGAIFCGG